MKMSTIIYSGLVLTLGAGVLLLLRKVCQKNSYCVDCRIVQPPENLNMNSLCLSCNRVRLASLKQRLSQEDLSQ